MVMTPEAFYSRVGDRFGATAGRSNPHRGQDFPWPARTEIPAFRDLTYLATHNHGGLGHVAVAKGSDGIIVGFSHLYQACKWQPRAIVRKGQVIGLVGNTGSWSEGNHLHLSASPTSHLPWSGHVIDPLAYVHQSLSRTDTGIVDAGSGSKIDPKKNEEDYMYARLIRNASPGTPTFGAVMAINEQTGFEFHIPNLDYIGLLAARGVIRSTTWEDLPENQFLFMRQLAASVRPTLDAPALQKMLEAALKDVKVDVNATTIANVTAAAVETRLADEFKAIPGLVNDETAARLKA